MLLLLRVNRPFLSERRLLLNPFLFIGKNKKRQRGRTEQIKWQKNNFILFARGNIVFFTLWLCHVYHNIRGACFFMKFPFWANTIYLWMTPLMQSVLSHCLPVTLVSFKAFHLQTATYTLTDVHSALLHRVIFRGERGLSVQTSDCIPWGGCCTAQRTFVFFVRSRPPAV